MCVCVCVCVCKINGCIVLFSTVKFPIHIAESQK